MNRMQGDFTLPGEAGYDELTLNLAKKWGADAIRDCDGTDLSEEILSAGYDIYSTICLIREDYKWAKENQDKLQQNYLMSMPVIASAEKTSIPLLDGYFKEQFIINSKDDPTAHWQVFDRTTGKEIPVAQWCFDEALGCVVIAQTIPFHTYTVNFLAIRIWEEISMYNHITNDWGDKPHLMAVEPRHVAVQEQMLVWLREWCESHPHTNIVRFTSMFYNFAWFWGEDPERRNIFSDWGSYDFTVNPIALKAFEEAKGYKMTSEDFVQQGRYNATHNAPTKKYREWMAFVNDFVITFGKQCVDLVHAYGKKAYVFYDDSWIGIEPHSERFKEFGFDGLIKCVFNGFEARLCGHVEGVPMKELRLHPYLFPTGLSGEATFSKGGQPMKDAQRFWVKIRRALLRKPVDRIGLGGYLHLVEDFPDFCDYIEQVTQEFHLLKQLHEGEKSYEFPCKVGILTAWGALRTWTCSGHFHENLKRTLMHVLEALAGMPVEVVFLSFEEVKEKGIPQDVKVVINAGEEGSAWSGGTYWADEEVTSTLMKWVHEGGCFVGIHEPSACAGTFYDFRMAQVLGIDRDLGDKSCLGKYKVKPEDTHFITAGEPVSISPVDGIYVLDKTTKVLLAAEENILLTEHNFGQGKGIYLADFRFDYASTQLLLRLLCYGARCTEAIAYYQPDVVSCDCAYFEKQQKLVVLNQEEAAVQTTILTREQGSITVSLLPYEMKIITL